MKEILWNSLLSSLRSGTCVLVLGFDVTAAPKGVKGAREDGGKSMHDRFTENLLEQFREEGEPVRGAPLDLTYWPETVAQQYVDSPAFSTVNLKSIAADFYRAPGYDPGPVQVGLAGLPFGFVVTLCHDDLFERALGAAGKQPRRYWYHFRGEPRDNRELEGKPSPQAPIVYHLFGTCDEPNSLVLTENELLEFAINLLSGRPKMPDSVRNALRNKTFLFIGVDIRDLFVKMLLKLIMWALGLSGPSLAIDPARWRDLQEKERTVLFYRGTRMEIVPTEPEAFVDELRDRFEKAGGYTGLAAGGTRRVNVFISYERSDDAVARRIFDELPKDQFECWLDTALLQAGEDWNLEIEDKIKTSDYFLILNSENLARKDKGYVNKEMALALDQQKYRPAGATFIIPLVIGALEGAKVRRELQAIQRFTLRQESFSDDLREVARTMWRDFQRRSR